MAQHFRDLPGDISHAFTTIAKLVPGQLPGSFYVWYVFEGHEARLDFNLSNSAPMQLMFLADDGAVAFDNWVETL